MRTGSELVGFLGAAELLLDEDAYLAWADGRGEPEVPRDVRRALADFLSVVGGDGRFLGTEIAKIREMGDGTGWVAPSSSPGETPDLTVWHAAWVSRGKATSRCGACGVDASRALRVGEVSRVRWCSHRACQIRIAR